VRVPAYSSPLGTTYSWNSERATRLWALPPPSSFSVCPVCCPDTRREELATRFLWAVDAWPELTDAILTELSGR